jgi:hypothetical protein
MYLFCIKSNFFEANMKQMTPINGVCKYTKTCE